MKKLLVLLLAGSMLFTVGCGSSSGDIVYSNENVELSQYKNLSVEKNVYTVTQDDIDDEINFTLVSYADYVEVDRAAEEGDYVTLCFTGSIGGEVVMDYSTEEESYELILGDQEYGVEFDENIIGTKPGDVLDFSVFYDAEEIDEESWLYEFADQTIDYHVEVSCVTEEILPEYTDEFVTDTLGYESKEEFETEIQSYLEEDYTYTSDSEMKEELLAQIIESSTIKDYSDEQYEECYNSLVADYQSYADMSDMTLDELLEAFGMTTEDLEEEALTTLERSLIISAIAECEDLAISDEEFDSTMEEYASYYEYDSAEDFIADYGEDYLRTYLLEEKVLQVLADYADITEVEADYN